MTLSGSRGPGSLVAIGTGIQTVGQLTVEAIAAMKNADVLLYVVADPIAVETIHRLNPCAESLSTLYVDGQPRITTYLNMVERTLFYVRKGQTTCLALYGHPGVFAFPAHEAIRRARAEGYPARMLPGISAEDCLFADLGVDPADHGCQSYEATDFLSRRPMIDPRASLIIWQIGAIGDLAYRAGGYALGALATLVERLANFYPPHHPCTVYEAPVLPGTPPCLQPVSIVTLSACRFSSSSTLFVPPVTPAIARPGQ